MAVLLSCNLIAEDPSFRSQGLRVEYFVRPPVSITINLCIPVTISCALLCLDLQQGVEQNESGNESRWI